MMNPCQSLLVVVPPAAVPTAAVKRAVALARSCGALLHLCMFAHDPVVELIGGHIGTAQAAEARENLLAEARRRLSALASSLATEGLQVDCDVLWAPVQHDAVIAKAVQTGARLVIKDAHRTSALRKAFFTPLDWRLMRLLPCALMLVQPGAQPRPRRMAAAVDVLAEPEAAGGLGGQIVETAVKLARYFDSRLDVASVFPYLPLHGSALLDAEEAMDRAVAAHRTAFAHFMSAHLVPSERRHSLVGPPADVLARFVREHDIDLMVVGATHRSGLSRLLLGSTAESLVQEIDADVLLVKSAQIADDTRVGFTDGALRRPATHASQDIDEEAAQSHHGTRHVDA